ncbi:hypothetical protein [Hymenobacter psoromatis]|uniref:hypothetical protein n=1 Tax=Hymenobacter psoromatis TaxID=1484116 RepID=UPI001CBD624F|nr:hypothetical protein [Hymenobacter psoromatis]
MNVTQQAISELLQEIAAERPDHYLVQSADEQALATFEQRAVTQGVPTEVIRQLLDFYQVANAFSYEFCLGFFACEDEIIFEWWKKGDLWLSLMHMDIIRWSAGKFCVGDASNVSYSAADEYETLLALLIGCRNYIKATEAEEPEPDDDY